MVTPEEERKVTVYFNGDCPVCSREIGHYQRVARSNAPELAFCDLAQHPGALAGHGLDDVAAKRRLYATDSEGRLVGGIDSFLLIWERLPLWRRLVPIVRLAPVRRVADIVYERLLVPALLRLNSWRDGRRKAHGEAAATQARVVESGVSRQPPSSTAVGPTRVTRTH